MGKISQIIGSALAVVIVFCASSVMAETVTSPSYRIDGNLSGNFGGDTSSTSYKMSAIGGEAIVGNGASGSYMIDQQYNSAIPTMQLGVQPSGLVGYYPMDENVGTTTADASRYQNNGTLNGAAAWYTSGKLGSAIDMNTAGSVRVPDNANLPSGNAMTVELWANQNSWISNSALASHWLYGSNAASWALQTGTNNNLRVFIANSLGDLGDNYVDTAANTWTTLGAWRHVVMVFDGAQSQANMVKIYIDGVLQNATVFGTLPSSLQNSGGELSIGSFPGLGREFNGALDHVKIFNRALTTAEIKADYTAQNAGISTGLSLGTQTSVSSTTSLVDAIVRTNVTAYNLAVQQDHDLQYGVNFIPSVSGSIGTPLTWSEGATKGLGFTLTGAPTLDSKWNSGAKYAAVPSSSTTFYSGTGHTNGVVDVVNLQLRLGTNASQLAGNYTNNLTYTGTTTP